jgi:peptide deformylase
MTTRTLLLFPDPRLRQKAAIITEFGAPVEALARDVLATIGAESAIGLTAPHIGVLKRLVVVRLEPGEVPRVFVNPETVWSSSDSATHEEGSVSMPGVRERIARPAQIRFTFSDQDGQAREDAAEGFLAAVLQHEIDQLDGIFWIDRLSRLKRERAVKRFNKLQSGGAA